MRPNVSVKNTFMGKTSINKSVTHVLVIYCKPQPVVFNVSLSFCNMILGDLVSSRMCVELWRTTACTCLLNKSHISGAADLTH